MNHRGWVATKPGWADPPAWGPSVDFIVTSEGAVFDMNGRAVQNPDPELLEQLRLDLLARLAAAGG
ncbi:hypothetical protein GCM10027039_08120 [Terrabacter koreensis]